jgi:hypothetical protein
MRIEVFAICYNEEIMLPYFLRHYSRFCEKITIFDNFSTDRSLEICRQNPLVEVHQYDSGNQIRDDIYLQIKNNYWKGSTADWVIVCDIDELLYGNDAFDNFTVISPDWWEMVSDRLPAGPGQIYDEMNQGVCLGQATKCIMFRPESVKEINYIPGAHGVDAVGDIRILRSCQMKILHYKYFTLQHVIDKYALYSSRLSEINKKNSWGYHYNFDMEKIRAYYEWLQEKKVNL